MRASASASSRLAIADPHPHGLQWIEAIRVLPLWQDGHAFERGPARFAEELGRLASHQRLGGSGLGMLGAALPMCQIAGMRHAPTRPPAQLAGILERTALLGFGMACDARTGSFLRTMAAAKPGGCLVELGTGTGAGTAWILDGMSADARLVSIDSEAAPQTVARDVLGEDSRLDLITASAGDWLATAQPRSFDFVFADAWIGKFEMLDRSLGLLRPGGVWIGDDLLPRPDWPESHVSRVTALLDRLGGLPDHCTATLDWASGIVLVVRQDD